MNHPFSLLIKPASADCNLRCEYCFYIDHASLYPETAVHRMTDETLEAMIASFLSTEQPSYSFAWQGGEPTLMGQAFFEKAVTLQKKYARPGALISNALQTNGTLIDEHFAKFLSENHFLVGVSLDGPPEMHDAYRVSPSGQGTHSRVMQGIELLKKHRVEFNILSLIHAKNVGETERVYRFLKDLGIIYHQYIPCVEFDESGRPAPFSVTGEQWGHFLCRLFDLWYPHDTRRISIRHFDAVVNFLVEGIYTSCSLAGNCCKYFVVEANGDIYPCDFFVEPQRLLGNVCHAQWDELQNAPKYIEFGALKTQWNDACKSCEYLPFCSGDCLKHRIYAQNPPENISALCEGWKIFYAHSLERFKQLSNRINVERQKDGLIGSRPRGLYPSQTIGRNEPCYCGSGKKYKKCHGV